MDALRLQPDVPNIPYMHLFHDLKQKFPFLKDSEINESIQKYGLDRDRCIAELSQRHAIPPGGYYGPWGRGSSGSGFSSPALSRVASPLRGGTPTTPTTTILTATSNMMPQLHHTTATHLVLHPQSSGYVAFSPSSSGSTYTSPRIITSPTSYHPPLKHPYGWTSVVSNGPCMPDMSTASLASGSNQDTPLSSRDPSRSPTPARSPSQSPSPSPTSDLPSSAPVMITNFDPFCDYKNYNSGTPHRRNSVETVYDKQHGLYYNIQNYEQIRRLSLSPVRSQCSLLSDVHDLSSPASPTPATVSTTPTMTAAEASGSRKSAIVQEQSTRKKRLEEELNKSIKERNELESEVEKMKQELEAREHQRNLNADANAQRIEDVQLENQRLQSECDQMESEILRIAPLTETEEYLDLGKSHVTSPLYEPLSLPTSGLSSQLTGGGSLNNVNNSVGSPMTAHAPMIPGAGFTPTRPAPPPPQPTSFNYPPTQGVLNNDESERNWSCSKCTFINHPGLNKCEMCEFPRFNIGRASSSDMMVVDVPSLAGPQAASGLLPHSHQGPCYCHRSHHTQAGVPHTHAATHMLQNDRPFSSLPNTTNTQSLTNKRLKETYKKFHERSDSV
ncbi:unnamed protein product [Meganyctiphanes norvegica]|uniref:RanBP2-type domain-containing protein n=1 Tax=Meganyctiphanes norvegica TaxID=48144 RepID=A0AAV2RJE1_MEGNR